jgi:hypothetical protein
VLTVCDGEEEGDVVAVGVIDPAVRDAVPDRFRVPESELEVELDSVREADVVSDNETIFT